MAKRCVFAGDVVGVLDQQIGNGNAGGKTGHQNENAKPNESHIEAEGPIKRNGRQDHDNASHCRKISKSDAHLDWNESATTLRNKIHAYFPWPGAYFFIETAKGPKRLTVVSAGNCEEKTEAAPGTVLDGGKNRWLISCGENSVLEIFSVKPEGKKLMSAGDFLRGSRLAPGMNLNKN